MPGYSPRELIGRTFLDIPQEDGTRLRLRIVRAISNHLSDLDKDPTKVRFLASATKEDVSMLSLIMMSFNAYNKMNWMLMIWTINI
jgi:hypothetical protein